ncbi:hypothetical protein D3C78_1642740 [compost metagenome]
MTSIFDSSFNCCETRTFPSSNDTLSCLSKSYWRTLKEVPNAWTFKLPAATINGFCLLWATSNKASPLRFISRFCALKLSEILMLEFELRITDVPSGSLTVLRSPLAEA